MCMLSFGPIQGVCRAALDADNPGNVVAVLQVGDNVKRIALELVCVWFGLFWFDLGN